MSSLDRASAQGETSVANDSRKRSKAVEMDGKGRENN